MTQERLAEEAGFGVTQISSLERGRRNPTYASLRRISHGLGLSLAELVERAEELEDAAG
jgi:transcriptional regulator with XRE-family HTH domain